MGLRPARNTAASLARIIGILSAHCLLDAHDFCTGELLHDADGIPKIWLPYERTFPAVFWAVEKNRRIPCDIGFSTDGRLCCNLDLHSGDTAIPVSMGLAKALPGLQKVVVTSEDRGYQARKLASG